MSIDPRIEGRRFASLTTAYADFTGRRIACRCVCSRLVFVAAADLVSGTVTSCGCQPAPTAYHEQLAEFACFSRKESSRENHRTKDKKGGGYLSRLTSRYGSHLPGRLELFAKRRETGKE